MAVRSLRPLSMVFPTCSVSSGSSFLISAIPTSLIPSLTVTACPGQSYEASDRVWGWSWSRCPNRCSWGGKETFRLFHHITNRHNSGSLAAPYTQGCFVSICLSWEHQGAKSHIGLHRSAMPGGDALRDQTALAIGSLDRQTDTAA